MHVKLFFLNIYIYICIYIYIPYQRRLKVGFGKWHCMIVKLCLIFIIYFNNIYIIYGSPSSKQGPTHLISLSFSGQYWWFLPLNARNVYQFSSLHPQPLVKSWATLSRIWFVIYHTWSWVLSTWPKLHRSLLLPRGWIKTSVLVLFPLLPR